MFLFEEFDERATPHPLIGKEAAAPVGRMFFETGGFEEGEFTKGFEHLLEARAQERKESLRKRGLGHEGGMVATKKCADN